MGALLQAALDEVTAHPATFAVEAGQALVLIAALAWAVRRFASRRLEARREGIASALAEADRAEQEVGALHAEARDVVVRAEQEAARLVASAREEAGKARQAADAAVEAEAALLIRQASETLEREQQAARAEASERLVRLTTATARRYLDEVLTDAERRALTQKAIVAGLEELERGLREPGAGT
ncbi:ATP synthase F0 subunit B [Anaeromyxobacter sp. PSR-1]|uniref:ATP synthase F0 subunit B n=1 Tax=Anaeromyxobacter sp. PSR-1 TaxID=1300915 RepID=UPI0005E6CA54|nr:ATP synthase F0 subunit B [Anaeromyxobacter sp. PSR-1]GAO02159.1 ATP synthase subunit b [Anaeromyxobacter sp. PSR-1]